MINHYDDGWLDAPEPPRNDQAQALDLSLAVFGNELLQAELIAAGALVKFGAAAAEHSPALKAEHFHDINLRHIAEAALTLASSNELGRSDPHCFVEMVQVELDRMGVLAAVGGPGFVMDIWLHQAPSVPELIRYWADRVMGGWLDRETIKLIGMAQQSIANGDGAAKAMTDLLSASGDLRA